MGSNSFLSNLLNATLLISAIKLARSPTHKNFQREKSFFKYTIFYLFMYFGILIIVSATKKLGLNILVSWPVLF